MVIESPQDSMEVGIQAKDICKIYENSITAIHTLSLDIYKGQITVIFGHSGSGKSTLMSILTGKRIC